ncbi:hypothetical protein KSP39_PZI022475 [Platanthera zijinensis]|uniref:AAR2 N-terminal domain-containing protein n=1 Tax=Platanthera zijinensis TaxID=2320716 RepID=A0AAP0AUJ7_9ASPA
MTSAGEGEEASTTSITPARGKIAGRWKKKSAAREKITYGRRRAEENRYSGMVKRMEFDHCLGPYPLDQYGCWKQLSSYISKSTISRIEPIGAEISIAHESTLSDQEKNVKMEKWLAMQLECNNLLDCSSEKTEKRRCYFTTIPKVVKHRNITGEKLTALNLDKVIVEHLSSLLIYEKVSAYNDFNGCVALSWMLLLQFDAYQICRSPINDDFQIP